LVSSFDFAGEWIYCNTYKENAPTCSDSVGNGRICQSSQGDHGRMFYISQVVSLTAVVQEKVHHDQSHQRVCWRLPDKTLAIIIT